MMKTPRWRGYPLDVKADMQSSALLRCMRACVLADTSMGAQKVMSYFIRAIWLAFKRVVDSYYDDL